MLKYDISEVDCGSCKNVTEDGGTVESPHFSEYHSNLNCLFTINAPGEKKIKLSFTELTMDKCCDFITVRHIQLKIQLLCYVTCSSYVIRLHLLLDIR